MNINNSHITYLPLLLIAYLGGCATSLPETASTPPTTPIRSALAQESLEGNLESSKEITTAKKVVVEIYNRSGNSGGTGFIIEVLNNRLYILTAAHLIEGNSQPKVNIFSQGDHNAKVLSVDEQRNLALLVVENEDLSATTTPYYLPENNELTTTGKVIFTIGFPKEGKLWAYQKLSYAGIKNKHLLFAGDLIEEGNSGGPVMSENKIVGMIAGKSEQVYAISPRVIRSFLQTVGTEGPAILAKHNKRQSAAIVKMTIPTQGPANKSAIQTTAVAGKAVKPPAKSADKTAQASGTDVVTPASTTSPAAPPGKDSGPTATKQGITTGVASSSTARPVTSSEKQAVVATQEKAKVVTPKAVTPLAKQADSVAQVKKETVTTPVTATTSKSATAGPAATAAATSPPKTATVTTDTTTPTASRSVAPLAKQPDATQVKPGTVTVPVTSTTPKTAPTTKPATATSPPKTATATTGTPPPTTSKSVTPLVKQPDSAQIKKESVAKSTADLSTPATKINAPQTKVSVTRLAKNSLPATALKESPQPTEKTEPKTESASLNVMCTAIVTDNMDSFRKEAKLLKKNSNLSYLASNVIQALSLQDRKTVLEHSLKFLFEAFLLSHDAKDSTCSPLLLKLKADELDALKRGAKNK
jgi:S1-C subfamily serine protease